MKIEDRENPEFKELEKFVFKGVTTDIDDWFNKHNVAKNKNLERKLTLRILNTPYFFSFQTLSTSKKHIECERILRETGILKNLHIENQLLLFSPASIDSVVSDHFSVIKLTPKNKDYLKNSGKVVSVITQLLNEENFIEIEKINKLLGWQTLEQKTEGVTFCYKEKNSHGTFYVKIQEKLFSPKYDFVFNFTKEKKDFLISQSVDLPTTEQAKKMHDLISYGIIHDSLLKNYSHLGYMEKVDMSFKIYEIEKNYMDLSSTIVRQEGKKTKNKL
jgi:hypothetical protein